MASIPRSSSPRLLKHRKHKPQHHRHRLLHICRISCPRSHHRLPVSRSRRRTANPQRLFASRRGHRQLCHRLQYRHICRCIPLSAIRLQRHHSLPRPRCRDLHPPFRLFRKPARSCVHRRCSNRSIPCSRCSRPLCSLRPCNRLRHLLKRSHPHIQPCPISSSQTIFRTS